MAVPRDNNTGRESCATIHLETATTSTITLVEAIPPHGSTPTVISSSTTGQRNRNSLTYGEPDDDVISEAGVPDMEPAVHPVSALQGPFQESVIEDYKQKIAVVKSDDYNLHPFLTTLTSVERHYFVRNAKTFDSSWRTRWCQTLDARHHPISKVISQLVFGMHLLQHSQAKSDDQVQEILQFHIDEIDAFLERTGEDIDVAMVDINDRIYRLEMCIKHMDMFMSLLHEQEFRAKLLDGNAKIDHISHRTDRMRSAFAEDLDVCLDALQYLRHYMDTTKTFAAGENDRSNGCIFGHVYSAMDANENGWTKLSQDLLARAESLACSVYVLSALTKEIARLADVASRKRTPHSERSGAVSKTDRSDEAQRLRGPTTPILRSKFVRFNATDLLPITPSNGSGNCTVNEASPSKSIPPRPTQNPYHFKPLPREPRERRDSRIPGTALAKPHPIPFKVRYEQPRAQPPTPQNSSIPVSATTIAINDQSCAVKTDVLRGRPTVPVRRKHAAIRAEPRDAQVQLRSTTGALAEYFRTTGPERRHTSAAAVTTPAVKSAVADGVMSGKPTVSLRANERHFRSHSHAAKDLFAKFDTSRQVGENCVNGVRSTTLSSEVSPSPKRTVEEKGRESNDTTASRKDSFVENHEDPAPAYESPSETTRLLDSTHSFLTSEKRSDNFSFKIQPIEEKRVVTNSAPRKTSFHRPSASQASPVALQAKRSFSSFTLSPTKAPGIATSEPLHPKPTGIPRGPVSTANSDVRYYPRVRRATLQGDSAPVRSVFDTTAPARGTSATRDLKTGSLRKFFGSVS